jgi:hypothetical protein
LHGKNFNNSRVSDVIVAAAGIRWTENLFGHFDDVA